MQTLVSNTGAAPLLVGAVTLVSAPLPCIGGRIKPIAPTIAASVLSSVVLEKRWRHVLVRGLGRGGRVMLAKEPVGRPGL